MSDVEIILRPASTDVAWRQHECLSSAQVAGRIVSLRLTFGSHLGMNAPTIDSRRLGYAAGFLLAALAVLILVPGIHVTLFDRDEGWYAEVCREMAQSGDWWTPRYLGAVWLTKPPLAFWLVAASYSVFGIGAWQGRLVSVLASAAAVAMVGVIGTRLCNRRTGIAAGAVFATAALPAIAGRMILTDPSMLVCTLGAILLHEGASNSPSRTGRLARHAVACGYWALIGAGVLAKGPATPLFAGAFAVALAVVPERRSWIRDWHWWAWSPAAFLVAAPWYAAMALRQSDAFTTQLFGHEIVSRALDSLHGHGGPPGYYLLVSMACFLPWTALVPSAWRHASGGGRDQTRRLLVVWMAIPWVLLEFTSTKLPHYILPCFVPLAILVGRWLDRVGQPRPVSGRMVNGERRLFGVWAWSLVVVGTAGAIAALTFGDSRYRLPAAVCAALFGLGFAVTARLVERDRLRVAGSTAVATCVLFHAVFGMWLLPALDTLWVSRPLAARLDAAAKSGDEIYVCGYEEPSTFFYLRHPARVVSAPELGLLLARQTAAVIAISDKILSDTVESARGGISDDVARRLTGAVDPTPVRGFNYVKGRTETIWIARVPAR